MNPAGLCDISLHVRSYTVHPHFRNSTLYNYLPMYMHSYIHDMYTRMLYVIVQCVVIASTLYCYNYLSSRYLYVRSSVTSNLFTLFPLLVAGLVYQHSVRKMTTVEANSRFSQFVSLRP